MINYFPTKLAQGVAFCNRKLELKRLKYNIMGINPVLIISPRRYGKTSLALRAFNNLKWPFVHIDLYKAFNEEDIEHLILNGIGELLAKLEKTPSRLIQLASDFFSALHVNVSVEKEGFKLQFSRKQEKNNPIDNIFKALKKLHDLAKKRKKRVILYLDEFQVVGEVKKNYAIEAIIREIAQQSEHIAFVFSGSDRHLIEELFNDKKRPFYNLCDIIKLERISEKDYNQYLQKASMQTWKESLSSETITQIFKCTACHAYYLNKLCSLLWQGKKPAPNLVIETWQNFVAESRSAIERELALLTLNQRKILTIIASVGGTYEPFSKKFLSRLNLSNSSAARAIKVLLEKDYLRIRSDNLYQILDPLMQSVLE